MCEKIVGENWFNYRLIVNVLSIQKNGLIWILNNNILFFKVKLEIKDVMLHIKN